MNKKFARLSLAVFLVATLIFAVGIGSASADDGAPVSGDGVAPIEVTGNPSCSELGYSFGFKIDGQPIGSDLLFYLIASTQNGLSTVHTGGAIDDSSNSVTVTSEDGVSFDWMATLGIDAVIVKGGRDTNAYVYIPEDTADTGLASPENASGESAAISHIEFCYDYELTASKTANADFTRTYTWNITKSVDPASHSGFAGDTFSSDYDVVVDQTIADSDFAVSGEITVNNPTPFAVNFSVSDDVDGTAADVSCDTYDLDPGATATCTYSAALAGANNGTNTATITSNTSGVGGATASADYAFGDPTTTVGDPTVNVTDYFDGDLVGEDLGSASGDLTFEYDRDFACPTDADAYENGVYTDSFPNTAEIDETGQSADANVDLTCYAPVVTKDASASYDETHTWTIEKSVDPESQSGYPGDMLSWEWTVNVSETSVDSNFAVSGTIWVYNPADEAMTVDVSDVLDDGTIATVNCGGGSTSLSVAADDTGSCSYSASPIGKTATLNTATATLNGADFNGTANVNFVANVIGGTATVTDDEIGLNDPLTAGEGPWEFTGSDSHTCSTNRSDYGANGTYSNTVDNTATVTDSEGNSDSDDASTTYTCSAGFLDVKKTTDGVVNPARSIDFTLTGPGLPSGGVTMNTFGDADGVLMFAAALVPGEEYTVCENPVPAGFTSFWELDGTIVTPFNPDATDVPPQDLGVRCYTFTANEGQTRFFEIDNSHPGGDPRTIGYWKNWNTCTGGNQAAVAAKNGGAAAGVYILDNLLPQTLSTGDSITSDDYKVTNCLQAVKILSKQDQSGRNKASDAAYELASQLLAAKLNLAAGAETCSAVQTAVTSGQLLLDQINFNGSGDYLGSGRLTAAKAAQRTQALSLANALDQYNNGNLCP